MPRTLPLIGVVTLSALPALVLAQAPAPPVVTLGPAQATVEEPFSQIRGLRELSDGRVLVLDVQEKLISRVDFDSGLASKLGRTGAGPGEYERPFGLFALTADTTLVFDVGTQRFLPILPDGAMGIPFRLDPEDAKNGAQVFRVPDAVDAQGRFYFADAMRLGRDGRMERADSAAIYRMDRRTGISDTLARVALPRTTAMNNSGPGGMRMTLSRPVPFAAQDAWAVAPDGRVAIARAGDNHVEWWGEHGRLASGPRVPYTAIPVTDRDKAEAAEQASRGTMLMSVRGDAGSVGRTQTMTPPPLGDVDWPAAKPPFVARGARVAPDGLLWLERSRAAADPAVTYDVFDGQGRRAKIVRLPADRRLVGFGPHTMYLVRLDADDLQWLERYRRP